MSRLTNTVLGMVAFMGVMSASGAGAAEAVANAMPQRDASFFCRGVYWPGEWTYRDIQIPKLRMKKLGQTLDDLASNQVNAIWLTHVSAKEGAEIARMAAQRGIYLVASLGELAGENEAVRTGDQTERIASVLRDWADAPAPIAWGLGDEPKAANMHEMAMFANAWRKSGQPVTTVVMAGDVPSASGAGFSAVTSDIYPFFSVGDPNGPDTLSESTAYLMDNVTRLRRLCQDKGAEAWFMGAIFQEPWGRRDLDEKGNLVYLPGGNAHFRMPTPAEVSWQSWASVAAGAQGIFHFSLFFNMGPHTNALPAGAEPSWAVKEKTNSGAPGGMLYPDGRPTPQFEAMGRCFGDLAKVGGLIKTLKALDSTSLAVFHAQGWPRVGDVVRAFVDPKGTIYAVVVNGDLEKVAEVPVNVPDTTKTLTDMVSGQSVALSDKEAAMFQPLGKGFKQAQVKLGPGNGTILRLDR